jgi:hypothetical protein
MMLRERILRGSDRLLAVVIATIIIGTTLAFGGAVWWAKPVIAFATLVMVLAWLAHVALEGVWRVLKSPLAPVGIMALALAVVQIVPIPSAIARRISPRSYSAQAHGLTPDRPATTDSAIAAESGLARLSLSLDRSATLRWLGGAIACLAIFCVCASFCDRLAHTMVVWGSVVASLFLCATLGLVQLVGQAEGLYGFIEPGKGPAWSPSTADLMAVPNVVVLREAGEGDRPHGGWAVKRPDRPTAIAGLLGGPGAFLALGSLGLPLALGLTLHLLAPRGSRGSLWSRLRLSGHTGLAILLFGSSVITALLVGWASGWWLSIPFVIGLLVAGIPCARASGLKSVAVGTTLLVLGALAGGVLLGNAIGGLKGASPLAEGGGIDTTRGVWMEAIRVARDFPIVGAGLGSFATIHPYYKHSDEARTTALSSIVQWWAETGLVGLGLLGAALVWCLIRLRKSLRGVGSADSALGFGLVGAMACFVLFSALHWTVELTAVALAASAVAGTWNRWLSGGTDLFVERA